MRTADSAWDVANYLGKDVTIDDGDDGSATLTLGERCPRIVIRIGKDGNIQRLEVLEADGETGRSEKWSAGADEMEDAERLGVRRGIED